MKLFSLAPLAVVLLQIAVSPLQQPPASQGSMEGTVTRIGTVGTGQPLPGASVTITRRGGPSFVGAPVQALPSQPFNIPGAAVPRSVMTDDKGKFAIQGLEEGVYTVQIQADGYVAQPYGQRFPGGPGLPLTLTAGLAMKDINVTLTPAANISGRVRDTADQPLINVPVQLLRASYDVSGQRNYQSVGTTQTNDRGEYRMYWITPGRFYLLAGRPSTGANPLLAMMGVGAASPNGNEVPAVSGYAFYPGVADISNARAIDLQPGSELQAIDLVLTPKPQTYSIRGKVIDSRTGQQPPRANVFVSTQTPGLNSSGTDAALSLGFAGRNYNGETGALEIKDLSPGIYTVIATVQDAAVPGRSGPPSQSVGMIPVTVSAADVEGITVPVVPALSIPGRVRVDGQLPAPTAIDRLRVRLLPIGASAALQQTLQIRLSSGIVQNPAVTVAADGTFRLINVIPGEYRVDLTGFPAASNSPAIMTAPVLKEVRLDGVDGLNSPIRVSGTINNGLDILLGVSGGQINGTVTDLRSQPVPSTQVVIVPDRARYRSDLYKMTTTDQNGRFTLGSITPGDYRVFSWEGMENYAWFDPDLLARSEARGRAIHVTETSTETIDLRIIPAEGSR